MQDFLPKSSPVLLKLSLKFVCFSRNSPLKICKIQPGCQLLPLSVTSSNFIMSCPVVFHILFIQCNLGPRPSHLPAALTRSNWLTGPFSLISPQSAEQLLEQAARPGAGTWAGPVLLLACSLFVSLLLSLPQLSARPRHQAGDTEPLHFMLCAPACGDPCLARVPVSERVL